MNRLVPGIMAVATSLLLSTHDISYAQDIPAGGVAPHTNILSFTPIQLTDNGFGFGAADEFFLGSTNWVSCNVPVFVTFNPSTLSGMGSTMDPMIYLQPGVKLYTNMDMKKRTKLSLGPNLVFGYGQGRTDFRFPGTSSGDRTIRRNRFLMGAAATIGGNLFVGRKLFVGFDWSIGCAYINNYNGVNIGLGFLTQAGFRIGLCTNKRAAAAPAQNQ